MKGHLLLPGDDEDLRAQAQLILLADIPDEGDPAVTDLEES